MGSNETITTYYSSPQLGDDICIVLIIQMQLNIYVR